MLGILENMSGFVCPQCGHYIELFKSGGGEKAAKELNVSFLGKIPLDSHIVSSSNDGIPSVDAYSDSEATGVIVRICGLIEEKTKDMESENLK